MEQFYGTEADWQALISKLNGVYAAHVVFSETHEPLEIHVLAGNTRNSKAIVRDVQSALAARYGIDIDYHIISVAQITSKLQKGLRFRLAYAGIDIHKSAGEIEIDVSLSENGSAFSGRASGSSLPFYRMRCIAKATLDAVKKATGGTQFFELDATELVRSNGRSIVLTQVYDMTDATPLIGSAYADPDGDAAVVQSVLDAINRKLEIYTQEY